MITEQEYLIAITKPELPMELWFEYYREVGGLITDLNEFVEVFSKILAQGPVIPFNGNLRQINLNTAWNRYCHYYDTKFGIRYETTP